MAQTQLIQEIIRLSIATTWEPAKLEWTLKEVYEVEHPQTCICGHFPIIELCVLRNQRNSNETIVGNCCVKKFMGLPSDKIFKGVKRIRKDIDRSLNPEAIDYAFQQGWINEWELNFYYNIRCKRNFSERQWEKRREINELVLQRMRKAGKKAVNDPSLKGGASTERRKAHVDQG